MSTKATFVLVASNLKRRADATRAVYGDTRECEIICATLANVAEDFAIDFERENPRFDKAKFMAACGVVKK